MLASQEHKRIPAFFFVSRTPSIWIIVRPEPSRFLAELPNDDVLCERDKPKLTTEQKQEKTQNHLIDWRAILKGD